MRTDGAGQRQRPPCLQRQGYCRQGCQLAAARLLSTLAVALALAPAGAIVGGATSWDAVDINRKAHPVQGSSIKLEPIDEPWVSYAGDRGIATPTTFSWTDGSPTAKATKIQCGLYTRSASGGFNARVQLSPEATAIRAFVGSCCPSSGLLNISLFSRSGSVLAQHSEQVAGEKLANGVGNAELAVSWGGGSTGSGKPAAVSVRWTPLTGAHNIQFNALAVYRGYAAPCAVALCTNVTICVPTNGASNCSDVSLSDKSVVDWLHGGVVGPTPPPPAHPSCVVPHSLGELGHLQISGPTSPEEAVTWLQRLRTWREACLAELNLSDDIYKVPQLEWGKTAYFQPLMMPFDRYFYNETLGNYTVGRYLDSLIEQYSGIDSALLWPTYTNIGVDDRNQFQLIESQPGGVEGLRRVVDELHSQGVRVLWPYNPWDQGTRGGSLNATRAGIDDARRLSKMLKQTDGDGFFGDTISSTGLQQFYADAIADGHPVAIQPEAGGSPQALNYSTMGWGYWKYPKIPPIDMLKFLEPRYLTQVCDRWSRDKTNIIQLAWFNGDGVETWQNIWGIWQGLTSRDASALQRLGPLLRFFGRARHFLQSPGWVPHTPMLQSVTADVYASRWPLGNETLWSIVNRGATDATGPQLAVLPSDTRRYYDCYHGVPLTVSGEGNISFEVEAGGFGCVFATPNLTLSSDTIALLATMNKLTSGSKLNTFSRNWIPLKQTMVPIPPTAPHSEAPEGMATIPAVENYTFVATGVEIEGQSSTPMAPHNPYGSSGAMGVDVQFPWEDVATPHHKRVMNISKFYLDIYPVTRTQYGRYLNDSGYQPKDTHNFLRNWTKTRRSAKYWEYHYHPADAQKPVVHVSLNEARLYCSYYGRRLPHTWEWSYAAQGTDQRKYPWGTNGTGCNSNDEKCLDKSAVDGSHCPLLQQHTQGDQEGLANVTAYPQGASPFGVLDLVGNVWQFTDEFQDKHTRAVLTRGGSHYYPVVDPAAHWYYPNGPNMRQVNGPHGKYMLMSDSYDRAGTVGFRCAAD